VLLVGLRTDRLRRAKGMKTAGRKNQKRWLNEAASRDHGTEGHNNPARRGGLEAKKKSGHRRSVFFLTPLQKLRLLSRWNLDELESKLGGFRLEVFDL